MWIDIILIPIRIPDRHQHHADPQHWPQCKDSTSFRQQTVVGTVLGSDVHFGKLDQDPHQTGKLDPDQSKKVKALEGNFEALEGPNLKKVRKLFI
jgi:hypothetical protein